jgi:hypothetical protein
MHPIRLLIALILVTASPHLGAQPFPTTCTSGTPATISANWDRATQLELFAAPGSVAESRSFYVRDGAGNSLKNVEVEFTLADAPYDAVFGQGSEYEGFVASASPRRAVVSTSDRCLGETPLLLGSAAAGRFTMAARVVSNPSAQGKVPVTIVGGLTLRPPGIPMRLVVRPNVPMWLPLYTVITGTNGSVYLRTAGIPVTFTAPESGPSVRFFNGSKSVTVLTDAFGVARAPATANSIAGSFDIKAVVAGIDGEQAVGRFLIFDRALAEISVSDAPQSITYGEEKLATATVRFPGFPCEWSAWASQYLASPVRITADGRPLELISSIHPVVWIFPVDCKDGVYQANAVVRLRHLPFGNHQLVAEYLGNADVAPVRSAPFNLAVAPAFEADWASGGGRVKVGIADPAHPLASGKCNFAHGRTATLGAPAMPASAPQGVTFPHGLLAFDAVQCTWSAGAFAESVSEPVARRVLIEGDTDFAEGAVAWAYGLTRDNPSPHWQELRTSISGKRALFEIVDAGPGDDSVAWNYEIHATLAIGVPARAGGGNLQDIWWGGPQENGWGMTVTQHGDMLFSLLFIYDAQGNPRWLAMPGGSWTTARTFRADVFRPKGTPYSAYDVSRHNIGAPVGTANITLVDSNSIRLDYTIDGISGARSLERLRFGPVDDPMPRFDDLWWGGPSQNGWGLVLAQQYRNIFGLWFTYDDKGEATWFAAPSGTVDANSAYSAKLYRPTGSPWLGAKYDPSKQAMTEVGALGVHFYDSWNAGSAKFEVGNVSVQVPIVRVPF